jgi:hypothetical protein
VLGAVWTHSRPAVRSAQPLLACSSFFPRSFSMLRVVFCRPVFQWSTSLLVNVSHVGMPDLYDFDWQLVQL